MKAVDTNILVRVLTKDDPVQTPLAAQVLRDQASVSHGVLMETEWVLRSRYGWARERIASALTWLLAVESITFSDPDHIAWSVERYAAGADLADMLHLVASRDLDAFVTFDGEIAEHAGQRTPVRIEHLR